MQSMFTRSRALLMLALLGLSVGIALADKGSSQDQTQTRLKARLAGPVISNVHPEGNAEFRSESSRTRFKAEAEHVNLPVGTMLDVIVTHGTTSTTVGQIKLNALLEGELELESQHGAVVPAIQKGDVVTISNAGAAILSGVF